MGPEILISNKLLFQGPYFEFQVFMSTLLFNRRNWHGRSMALQDASDFGGLKAVGVEWYINGSSSNLSLWSLVGPRLLLFLSGGFQLFLSFCESTEIFLAMNFLFTWAIQREQSKECNTGSGLVLPLQKIFTSQGNRFFFL